MDNIVYRFFSRYYRYFLIISLILLVTSSLMLSYAYSSKEYLVEKQVVKYAKLQAFINTAINVKPALIYNYAKVIYSDTAYYTLTEKIYVNMSIYVKTYENELLGSIVKASSNDQIRVTLSTEYWTKEYYVNYTRLGDRYSFAIDLDEVDKIVKMIDSEIEQRSRKIDYHISLDIIYQVLYSSGSMKTYSLNPSILVSIDKDSNRIEIKASGLESKYSEENRFVKEKLLNPLNISVTMLRRISLYMTLSSTAFFIPFLTMYLREELKHSRVEAIKKFLSKTIDGKVLNARPSLIVEVDLNTIIRISKIYKRLPVYDRVKNRLYLLIGDTIYVANVDKTYRE